MRRWEQAPTAQAPQRSDSDDDNAPAPRTSTSTATTATGSAWDCRGGLLQLTHVTVGAVCYSSPHHPEGDEDARRGRRPGVGYDPRRGRGGRAGGAGGVGGEVRPDDDPGAVGAVRGAGPLCADRGS